MTAVVPKAMRIARIDFRVQVPTGGDLDGLRQRLRHHPVTAAAVAQDNFDLGMIGDPRLHGRNLAVGQERHGSPPLQIVNDRSVAMISAPRPIVDAGDIQLVIRQVRSQPHDPHNSVSLLTGTISRSLEEPRQWTILAYERLDVARPAIITSN